ncbi:DUF7837 family putative zinc-binding protein [Halorubrum miltondacostae]|uniref:DUF7837 family putative zinc-binding protein n=2 Tax=Halorubrum miltondacostae TaxID=3076378 RepID=UPI0040555649
MLRRGSTAESVPTTRSAPKQCHTLPLPLEGARELVRMTSNDPETVRGDCSFCGETVTDRHAIIHYETTGGDTGVWAECPRCGEIVDPTDAQ